MFFSMAPSNPCVITWPPSNPGEKSVPRDQVTRIMGHGAATGEMSPGVLAMSGI